MKIISGAQTGADRAAIDWAIENNLDYGGWVPKGRKAEDGTISMKYDKLLEMTSTSYPARTQMNVREGDITIIFHFGPLQDESGCALTRRYCQQLNKPHMVSDLLQVPDDEAALFLTPIMKGGVYKVINVAGSRESKAPGIYTRTKNILRIAWAG